MNIPANSRSTVSSAKNDSERFLPPVKEVNLPITVDSTNTESVKKRVEEFEKRTAAAVLSASKLPIMTPEKKAQLYSSSENQQLKVALASILMTNLLNSSIENRFNKMNYNCRCMMDALKDLCSLRKKHL